MLKTKLGWEFSRVLSGLGFPQSDKVRDSMVAKCLQIHHILRESPKYNTVERLTLIIIYIYLTLQNFRINKSNLISVSLISHSELYNFLNRLNNHICRFYS
ncbi:hypothetical protein LCGC14_0685400 [marine sediment metagenome]|uniref:Uncharacterized protein n=1 Tax=marine sediment metagenome TaxID=412755 RepID=A0A0F9TV00_9ZZZZ